LEKLAIYNSLIRVARCSCGVLVIVRCPPAAVQTWRRSTKPEAPETKSKQKMELGKLANGIVTSLSTIAAQGAWLSSSQKGSR
jgi:hypothetical protein